ncbi:MAG: hypothetical protein IJH48_01925 [Oscillospiraceae bacterium]|nr:hypothetical protein [Oscillospiraceae bacterium]
MDSETHEIDHGGNPTEEQMRTDMHAFDHKFYALGKNPLGEIALYRITVEDLFSGKDNQNDMVFHNLRYIEKIADDVEKSLKNKTANPPTRPVSPSAQRGRSPTNLGGSTASYTVADLYQLVKEYDKEFNVNPHDEIDLSFLIYLKNPLKNYSDFSALFLVRRMV